MITIDREIKEWGVRLSVRPFAAGSKHHEMWMLAELSKPPASKPSNVPVVVRFSGVSAQDPMTLSDAKVWNISMQALFTEVMAVAKEIREKNKKKRRSQEAKG